MSTSDERSLADIAREHGWSFRTEKANGGWDSYAGSSGRDYVFERDDVRLMFHRRGYGHAEATVAGHTVRLAGVGIVAEARARHGGLPDPKLGREAFAEALLRWFSVERVFVLLVERLEEAEMNARREYEKAVEALARARRAFARQEYISARRVVQRTAPGEPSAAAALARFHAAAEALAAAGVLLETVPPDAIGKKEPRR